MSNEDKNNRYLTGLVLLTAGFLLLAYKMGAPIPGWLFTWPVILIVVSLLFAIRQGFRNIGWVIMLIVGSVGLIDKLSPGLDFKHYMAPIIIISIGAWFLLRPKTNWNKGKRSVKEWNNDKWEQKSTNHEQEGVNDSEYLRISSVFSGFKRTIISKNFQGGDIACVFGGAEVDLSQSDIQGTVTIKIEQVFGGTKLIIPPHWRMVNDIEGVFHGVDDRRSPNNPIAIDPNKTLVLKGSVVFGGIDVRSY
jgi:predicted membrane protein